MANDFIGTSGLGFTGREGVRQIDFDICGAGFDCLGEENPWAILERSLNHRAHLFLCHVVGGNDD